GTHPAVARLDDDVAAVHAHDPGGLAQHDLVRTRILSALGARRQLPGEGGGLDLVQAHDGALGLGHDLLAHHDHVVRLEADARRLDGVTDERGEIVARLDHRQPWNRDDGDRHGAAPPAPKAIESRPLTRPAPPAPKPVESPPLTRPAPPAPKAIESQPLTRRPRLARAGRRLQAGRRRPACASAYR